MKITVKIETHDEVTYESIATNMQNYDDAMVFFDAILKMAGFDGLEVIRK